MMFGKTGARRKDAQAERLPDRRGVRRTGQADGWLFSVSVALLTFDMKLYLLL